MRTIEQMIQSEVLCSMSGMVSTLAKGAGLPMSPRDLSRESRADLAALFEQAFELVAPVPDYEEAAIQAGWKFDGKRWYHSPQKGRTIAGWYDKGEEQALCEAADIEPYDREVFEHWAVTDWFADKLIAQGEKVDKDFAGLCIWARTTTGQAIYADGIIERIYAETRKA